MRKLIIPMAALALFACQKTDVAANADAANAAMANDAMATNNMVVANDMMAPAALTSINHTTWEFTDAKSGKPMQESVDDAGKYISQSGKEHIDHGTAVMKGGKACFTSAMTKVGEVCWSDPMIAVGQSGETTSDKGEKLPIKRVEYAPLTM